MSSSLSMVQRAGLNRSMQTACLLAMSWPLPVAHADNAAVLNERPPMSRAELERHWGVDCRRTLAQAQTALRAASEACSRGRPTSEPSPSLQHQLRLCAAIYDPPGGEQSAACTVYRAALATGSCDQLNTMNEPRRDETCPTAD